MIANRWLIPVLSLAFAAALWADTAADKARERPAEEHEVEHEQLAARDRDERPGPESGRIVEPQRMEEPYKSDVPLAGDFTRDALQLKALSPSLVRNGSFEQGRYWPYYWDPVDRLGTLWVNGGTHGKRCIRIDTDIQEGQWLPWNENILALVKELTKRARGRPQSVPTNPLPPPPEKIPTVAPYYDTVAGLHGIHYRSAFFKATPGAIYRFSIDARGQSGVKIFIKGFIDERRKTEQGVMVLKRNAFRSQFPLGGMSRTKWQRFACVSHPARSKSTYRGKPVQPEWYQVQIYAYWPPGTYEFDNVRMDIVGYEEILHTREGQPEHREPETEPAKGMDGDFPIF